MSPEPVASSSSSGGVGACGGGPRRQLKPPPPAAGEVRDAAADGPRLRYELIRRSAHKNVQALEADIHAWLTPDPRTADQPGGSTPSGPRVQDSTVDTSPAADILEGFARGGGGEGLWTTLSTIW